MPIAPQFTALGRGNGFPFCVFHSTDANINSLEGHQDIEPVSQNVVGAADELDEVYRIREVSFTEAMQFIWNLYSVSFASPQNDALTSAPFNIQYAPALFKYNSAVTGYINATAYLPHQRVCNEVLGLSVPRATNPPRDDGDGFTTGGWFVAETDQSFVFDSSAQFAIRSIYRATDTNKYYIGFTCSVRADDRSFIQEIPFSDLTFEYYTYS